MIGEITKIILAALQNRKLMALAKNVSNIQVVETETHVIFFLSKTTSAESGIIFDLKQMIPESTILTTNEGKAFLNISLPTLPKTIGELEKEAANIEREQGT